MRDSLTRSKAADKLLKKLPEQDEEAPNHDEVGDTETPMAVTPPSGMPADSGPALADPGMPPGGGEPDADDAGAGSSVDIDSALAGVEAAIEGMPEDAAREIRTHLEAIKDIASREQGSEIGRKAILGEQEAPMPPGATDIPTSPDDAMGMDR
jgi:hypothetical protein